MFAAVSNGTGGWILVLAAALLGAALSPVTELLIAKLLPRLGGTPIHAARITTMALTGAVCAAFALRFGISWILPAFLFLAVLGVQLARIDASLHLLPNPLVGLLLAGGLFLFLAPAIFHQQADNMLRALLGMLILFAGYLILGIISPGAIGMGDVKLAAPVGLYLGYLGWTHLLYGGLLGFILNGVVTVAVLAGKRRNSVSEVPHGPSMLGATLAAALFLQ
ncbi:prepilin peptidase [Pseudarthrobacter enclensis]|uniref:prepilin peptidase n=1 Tax=Pseudarthrobacter enclensis TaxID=993070 RepID=UPI003431FD0E